MVTVGGKRGFPEWYGTSAPDDGRRHRRTMKAGEEDDDSDDDSEDGSDASEDDSGEDCKAPSVDVVLGKDAFSPHPPSKAAGGRQPSHCRRLRTLAPKRRRCDTQDDNDDGDDVPPHKKRRATASKTGRGASEPQKVRDADAKMIEPHPAVLFVREHTPVRPCGRCRECRKSPCGECGNCKNNAHLSDRSHDRKRCTTLGCTRMSDLELERYRLVHDSADSTSKIENDLRALRDRFMAIPSKGTSTRELEELTKTQDALMKRLQMIGSVVSSEKMPEGYGCLLLSFQTLETERDRIARLIDRRTTRDSPEVMRTRRQLRNSYALTICNFVRMFANDVVAGPHVERLKEIADEYERLVISLPICE
jgi:hypothetical protein